MSTSYAREKLGAAVSALATGVGDIQYRLVDAFMAMGPLMETDFDGPALAEWQSIYARATTKTDPEEGSFHATLTTMSDGDAVKLATDIVDLEYELSMDTER